MGKEEENLFENVSFGMPQDGEEMIDLGEINSDAGGADEPPVLENPLDDPTLEAEEAEEEDTSKKKKKVVTATDDDDEDKLDLEEINDPNAEADEAEEEEGEEDDKSKKAKKDSSDTEGKSSPVTPFATFLQEKGFLPNVDMDKFAEAENPLEALADAMNEEIKIANAGFINAFPPQLIDMARAVAAGVPFEALQGAKMDEINYSKITEESLKGEDNAEMQKRVVADGLASKGFKQAKIDRYIQNLEDSGDLESEAIEYKDELVETAKKRQEEVKKNFDTQQQEMSKQQKEYVSYLGQTIDKTDEIIPGLKMGKVAKDKLFNNMTQMVATDKQNNPVNFVMNVRQKDPVKFDLAVTYLADLTKGFTDWTKIKTNAKSSAAREVEKTLGKATTAHVYGKAKKAGAAVADTAEDSLMDSLTNMFPADK